MNSLNFGGAEKALVNLFDTMNYDVYEIDFYCTRVGVKDETRI